MTDNSSAAHRLEGLVLTDGWEVIQKIPARPDRTGGVFSVSYVVRHPSGLLGFCKALDFANALQDENPTKELKTMTNLYEFERDLLFRCGDQRLSRVVRVLAAGTIRVEGSMPDVVSYLILELADGDAHDLLEATDPADSLPRLRAGHHAAVGLAQLHRAGVIHQDVKPSNLPTWKGNTDETWESKIGDLGCAFDPSAPSPYDEFAVVGDPAYAAPETLYRGLPLDPSSWRRAAEMYAFGNLLCFLVTGVLPFGALQMGICLHEDFHWRHCELPFSEVLPYLVDSHGRAVERVREALHREAADPVATMLFELCYPDPAQRGDQVARRHGQNPYSLTRYITKLNLLITRIRVNRPGEERDG